MNSLSELRSREDLDLLERSTKKTKMDQNSIMMDALVADGPVRTAEEEKSGMEDEKAQESIPNNRKSYRDMLSGRRWRQEEVDKQKATIDISDDDDSDGEGDDPECPAIKYTKTEKEEMRKPWSQTLIIKVMGRSVGYNYLLNRIRTLWRPKNLMELMAINDDYFLVRFASEADYNYAKYGGPWMVLEHYLIVKEWRPNFNPSADKTENMLVWIRFPDLPIEYYGEEYLMKIGEKVGTPIKVDDATSLTTRGRFARMCVEIDLTKPLLAKYKLRRRIYKIEYEGIHLVCFQCGMYGHNADNCRSKNGDNNRSGQGSAGERGNTAADVTGEVAQSKDTEKEIFIRPEICDNFGPWMLTPSKSRRINHKQEGKVSVEGKRGSKHKKAEEGNQIRKPGLRGNKFGALWEHDENNENEILEAQYEENMKAKREDMGKPIKK